MTNYKQLCRVLTAELLKHEAKLSERQLMLLQWEQIGEGKIKLRQREVEISDTAYKGLLCLPANSRYVFGHSPLLFDFAEESDIRQRIAYYLESIALKQKSRNNR